MSEDKYSLKKSVDGAGLAVLRKSKMIREVTVHGKSGKTFTRKQLVGNQKEVDKVEGNKQRTKEEKPKAPKNYVGHLVSVHHNGRVVSTDHPMPGQTVVHIEYNNPQKAGGKHTQAWDIDEHTGKVKHHLSPMPGKPIHEVAGVSEKELEKWHSAGGRMNVPSEKKQYDSEIKKANEYQKSDEAKAKRESQVAQLAKEKHVAFSIKMKEKNPDHQHSIFHEVSGKPTIKYDDKGNVLSAETNYKTREAGSKSGRSGVWDKHRYYTDKDTEYTEDTKTGNRVYHRGEARK